MVNEQILTFLVAPAQSGQITQAFSYTTSEIEIFMAFSGKKQIPEIDLIRERETQGGYLDTYKTSRFG
jgi:hypothetical protein